MADIEFEEVPNMQVRVRRIQDADGYRYEVVDADEFAAHVQENHAGRDPRHDVQNLPSVFVTSENWNETFEQTQVPIHLHLRGAEMVIV